MANLEAFAYICLKTHRVFRTLAADPFIATARLQDTLVIRVPQARLDQLKSPAWVWGRGFYSDDQELSREESQKLKSLHDRCLALEILYRNVALWRQNLVLNIPFQEEAERLLFEEAQSYSETKPDQDIQLLKKYCEARKLDLRSGARLVQVAAEEKRACIVSSELFKIEWETKILNSETPLQELELLKATYPIF